MTPPSIAAPISLGILGAGGKMGHAIRTLIDPKDGEFKSQFVQTNELLKAQVVIDFSAPSAFEAFAKTLLDAAAAKQPLPIVISGTTGWTIDQKKSITSVSAVTPTLLSSNFSLGAMALVQIMKSAGPLLEGFGFKPFILETHHTSKKDAPSGTALSLQRAISPSGPGNIQTMSLRVGDNVGTHEVRFAGMGEQMSFIHQATDRFVFARGALKVALWMASASLSAGKIFTMDHVMNEFSKRVADASSPSV